MRSVSLSAARWGMLGLILLGASGPSASRAATLQWKFQPGATLHYTMDQRTVTSLKTGPQDVKTTMSQQIDMDWTVKKVNTDGSAELTQTVTRVHTKIE